MNTYRKGSQQSHYLFHQGVIMAPWFHTNPVLGDLENPTQEEPHNRRMQIKRILAKKTKS